MSSSPPADPPRRAGPQPKAGPLPDGMRRVSSQELFGSATQIEIEHQQQVYRLRQTSLGKLILTK